VRAVDLLTLVASQNKVKSTMLPF